MSRGRGRTSAQVVTLAAALVATGAAYERDGTVWFRGAGLAERAGLTDADAAALAVEFRHSPDGHAEHPADVPVWRRALAGEVAWPSPWGRGAAGLARRVRGDGAHDAGPRRRPARRRRRPAPIPTTRTRRRWPRPSRGCAPFARAWLHVGTVGLGGAKMAKSTGNLVLRFPTSWPSTLRARCACCSRRPAVGAGVGVRPGRARRRRRPAGAALRRSRPRRPRHGHGRRARRHRRAPRRPRRAPRPRRRRGRGRRGGAGRAVGARPADLRPRGGGAWASAARARLAPCPTAGGRR